MPEGVEDLRIAGGAGDEGSFAGLPLQERLGGRGVIGLLCWTDSGLVLSLMRARLSGWGSSASV